MDVASRYIQALSQLESGTSFRKQGGASMLADIYSTQ
jgi:hypothetical protein